MKGLALAALVATGLSAAPAPDKVTEVQLNRFLFFAVLQGLVEDGVPDSVVERILERNQDGRPIHFVYACPICHPVVEAHQAFRSRHDFYFGRKGDPYVTGNQLPKEIRALLADPDARKFREGLEKLVSRFVEAHLKRLRFTEDEKKTWTTAIADGRKQGAEMMKSLRAPLEKCPSCEGAFDAGVRR